MASVVVTGASRGIGLASALVLARAGHKVFAAMRNPASAPELAEITRRESLPVHIVTMDVDSDESVTKAFEQIFSQAGHIDVLVNNAGIERNGSTEELPLAEFRAVMETNYFGALRCIKAVIASMRQRKSGLIVNVTSIAGRLVTSPLGPYAASKFALEAVSEALAQEMKMFNVRVAVVEPGIIDTGMAQGLGDRAFSSIYPHQRRISHYFEAALVTPTSPSLVGEKILEIIESGTWALRHPVGPDAAPTLAMRASVSDEDYIALNSLDDDAWYTYMEERTGWSIRPKS
ncbi:MAG: SDR family oxidoreductase [Acidobacteriota bacterium]|nr:SDR family oxidoreductase [Acidobacteriota bacterium]